MPTRREVLAFTGLAALTGASATSALAGEPVWTPGVKTFSTAQKQVNILSAEKETVIFERKGPGCITHMWFGGNWPHFNQTRVRFYVDGQAVPSIDMEYGLGHGIGFDDTAAPWGVRQMGMTGHVGGLYNTFRIPFGKAIRITSQLAPGVRGNPDGWWIIRPKFHLLWHASQRCNLLLNPALRHVCGRFLPAKCTHVIVVFSA